MNLLTHTIAEGPINQLMLLHARFAAKRITDDYGLEVMSVAADFHMLAGKAFHDIALNVFRRDQGNSPEGKG